MARLKAHHVDFNTLTVVGKHNVGHAADVYEFLLAAGSRFIQFIPLVERMSTDNSSVLNLVMPAKARRRWRHGRYRRGNMANFSTRSLISGFVAT